MIRYDTRMDAANTAGLLAPVEHCEHGIDRERCEDCYRDEPDYCPHGFPDGIDCDDCAAARRRGEG